MPIPKHEDMTLSIQIDTALDLSGTELHKTKNQQSNMGLRASLALAIQLRKIMEKSACPDTSSK